MISTLAIALLSSAAHAGASASAFRPEHNLGANYWNATSAIDNDPKTCWMVPGESANTGEWLMIDVPKGDVDKIALMPGWAKDMETFKDYTRIKSVKVEVFSVDEDRKLVPVGQADVTVADEMKLQVLDIPDINIPEGNFGGKVKLTVTGVYDGTDYPSLAVSEALVVMKEFDAPPVISEVSAEATGHTKDMMTDDKPTTFWASSGEATITFEASGYGLSRVGLVPGPKTNARPKKVELTSNGRTVTADFPDAPAEQWIEIPPVTGYSGSSFGTMTIKVLETYPGTTSTDLGITELDLKATNYDGI